MKKVAMILVALVLLLGGVVCYQLLNSQLVVTGQGVQNTAATERAAEFALLQTAMERSSLEGTVFQSGELSSIGDYSFQVYTLRLKNKGLLPVQMVEIQLAPLSGDTLYYGEGTEVQIPAGGTREVWVSVLTTGGAKTVRDLYITYYIWGKPYSMKYTFNG